MSLLTKHFCFFSFPNLDIYEALVLAERWRGECRPGWWVVLMWQLPRYLYNPLRSERLDTGLQRPSCFSINLRLRFYGHLLVSRTDRMGSFPIVGRHIWPVLSRSWPSPHFLTRSHSDSRVEFIWYPPLVLLQSGQVSGSRPLSFDTSVSVWTLLCPRQAWVHLDRSALASLPTTQGGNTKLPMQGITVVTFTFPLLKCTGSYLNLELWGKLQRIHCEYVLF